MKGWRSRFCRLSLLSLVSTAYSSTPPHDDPISLRRLDFPNQPSTYAAPYSIPRGGGIIPAGYHPFGYRITSVGEEFLSFDGSLESDLGRFLASLKSKRRRESDLKEQWLEVVRVAKTGQSMRIYRKLRELIDFCLKTGLID